MLLNAPRELSTPRGRFAYRDTGSGGAPLVMIHGWPESSYSWQHVSRHLDAGFQVIAPDLRGLGDSERTVGEAHYHKAELAQDVISMLDALGIEQFQLVGHDWGGIVAQEIALAIPERVTRLGIMNIAVINNLKGNMEVVNKVRSSGGAIYWYQHFQQAPGLAEAMIPGNEVAWLRYFLKGAEHPVPEDSIAEYVRMYAIPDTPACAANYYRTFNNDAKRWATLTDHVWPMPSIYIYGNRDKVIIPEYLNHIEGCFKAIRVVQVKAGHFLHEEKPEEVAATINGFFQPAPVAS
ncbi:alpha/beta fold hydrolase [Marinobacter antarcticus]|uniref:Alpha/beta hydrolase n=1 Tax=Marinobacter antarcticus TaxID=564117 RepID=A0A831R789_9GAMM|nr:alpha/beta hydrolase [Marinobacter antarcticus]HEA53539.1 alpha/beta hydrolase [Marinobacter antarcticus]